MLTIYLARHGQNEDNANKILNGHRDLPLTELGLQQAEKTGEYLRELGYTFDVVYSSPLKRAHKTAEILAKKTESPEPVVLPDLIERDFWVMSWEPESRVLELCAPDVIVTEKINYFLSPKGAETFPDLVVRAKRLLAYLRERHIEGNILLATHGDFGKMVYCAYYDLDWKDVLVNFYFGNTELIRLSEDTHPQESHMNLVHLLWELHS